MKICGRRCTKRRVGSFETVEFLVEHGANLGDTVLTGASALNIARKFKHNVVIAFLDRWRAGHRGPNRSHGSKCVHFWESPRPGYHKGITRGFVYSAITAAPIR